MAELEDPRHRDLLDWLTTPKGYRNPPTQKAFAEKYGVAERTIRDWRDSPKFQEAWAERVRQVMASPERTQTILEALAKTAEDTTARGQVGAAKLYLEAVGSIQPIAPKAGADASRLSDEQLTDLLAELAKRKLGDRRETADANS